MAFNKILRSVYARTQKRNKAISNWCKVVQIKKLVRGEGKLVKMLLVHVSSEQIENKYGVGIGISLVLKSLNSCIKGW